MSLVDKYLAAKSAAESFKLDLNRDAKRIYALFAVEKDEVSTHPKSWAKRKIVNCAFTETYIKITVQFAQTEFYPNGLCGIKYSNRRLKLPSSWAGVSDEDLAPLISAFLDEEGRCMSEREKKKAA
jgi:hypothetical protein